MLEYRTLLLDLDGTLLDIEVSFFLGPMVQAMHGCFSDVLDEELFREGLFGSIEAIKDEPRVDGESNQKAFNRAFNTLTGLAETDTERLFQRFYRKVFPSLGSHGRPMPGAQEFVKKAADMGYTLALATNPIFPTVAVLERLRWAGIDPDLFHFIPGLETMSSCKPRTEYFLEMASRVNASPSECLMVGNDVEQDLPASEVGMGTYLVEGRVVSRGISQRRPDARGDLGTLGRMLGWEQ